MGFAQNIHGRVRRGRTATLLTRIEGWDGTPITTNEVAGIVYSIYELDPADPDSRTVVTGHDEVTLTVADVVFDSLQTDARWTEDDTGYNFRWPLDGSQIANFDVASGASQTKRYRAEAILTDTNGDKIVLVWQLSVTNVYSLEAS